MNASAEAPASCQGLVRSSGSMGELGVEVSGERVVFGELAGDRTRGLRTQPLRLVQRRELGELQLVRDDRDHRQAMRGQPAHVGPGLWWEGCG